MNRVIRCALGIMLLAAAVNPAQADPAPSGSIMKFSVGASQPASLRLYGFLETDVILDSTQTFLEEPDNNLVSRQNPGGTGTYGASHPRATMSVRNSRFGMDLLMPKTDCGLATEAVLEMDFLGNQAANTTPGASGATPVQSESSFFTNPTLRVRHAYVSLTENEWNVKIGQTWSILGWLPYYLPSEPTVQPEVGELFRRFSQVRLSRLQPLSPTESLELAADAAKPAEMNSGVPEFHGGLRLASSRLQAATYPAAGSTMSSLSAALSSALIPVRTGTGNATGEAVAADVFIPIIPSKDGKDAGNNLSATGEFSVGRGVGGLELIALTSGVPAVTNANGTGTTIDSGIAGINQDGNVELIRFRTFRYNVQYTFPGARWTASAGYAQAECLNLDRFSVSPAAAAGLAPKLQYTYAAAIYQPLTWLRFGAEVSQTRDTYNDPLNRYASNKRFQLTSYFLF